MLFKLLMVTWFPLRLNVLDGSITPLPETSVTPETTKESNRTASLNDNTIELEERSRVKFCIDGATKSGIT